jgi:uncharacterized protein
MDKLTYNETVINQTVKWIQAVVIGCNFCPFASRVVQQNQVHYVVEDSPASSHCIEAILRELQRLNADQSIETSFIIFPDHFENFDDFLDLVALAEAIIKQHGYEGVYQLASFHPLYLFADSDDSDAANFTNRSIHPMLHLLRESSIEKALEHYDDPENIPDNNINFARNKGLTYMKMLKDSCF